MFAIGCIFFAGRQMPGVVANKMRFAVDLSPVNPIKQGMEYRLCPRPAGG